MISRIVKLPLKHTFFLFGPRQTGKTTLLEATFPPEKAMFYNLLRTDDYLRLGATPSLFREEVMSRDKKITHIIVDEIQRIPILLNEIQYIIDGPRPPFFVLSGSSARKLKRSQANLLGGRAWTLQLLPLTHLELGGHFTLNKALELGTLPSVYLSAGREEAEKTLRSYVETYLNEEIKAEAVFRNLGNFLRFLAIAADENGNLINFSNIARETGVSYNTVKEYFQILEDTLIGFHLLPYSRSARRRLVRHPKFYFFDLGVLRALRRKISVGLTPKTYEYGRAFEHFIILEIVRLATYLEKDFIFSFYGSANRAEVDLIVETPDGRVYALEIKSTADPGNAMFTGLKSFKKICSKAVLVCVCSAPHKRTAGDITILPWQEVFSALELKWSGRAG